MLKGSECPFDPSKMITYAKNLQCGSLEKVKMSGQGRNSGKGGSVLM